MGDRNNRGQWVSGELPTRPTLHRRTSTRPAENGILAERMQRVRKQALVGRPLADDLRRTANARQLSSMIILLSVAGVALLVLAAFSSQPLLVGGGGLAALLAALMVWNRQQSSLLSPRIDLSGAMSHDAEHLDAYLMKVSGELPPDALRVVAQIKETLRQLMSLLPSEDGSPIDLPGEEIFFINQLVSRYLPDACRHYLDARRSAIHARNETSESLADSLNRQLTTLHERLQKTLRLLSEQHAQALSRHEAFLSSKQNRT